jgi:DNA polymerase I-like protein with 3'-5' exonuclease and polymerase domains
MRPPKTLKASNHLTLTNEMENLKLSSEMKLEEKGLKWDPSQLYITSRALNDNLPQPHKL